MKFNFCLLTSLLSAGLLFTAPDIASAQLSGVDADDFQSLEQPIAVKAAITVAGLGLIGVELWWFLLGSGQLKSQLKQFMQATSLGEESQGTESTDSSVGLAHSFNQEAHQVAIKITSVYDGIPMPAGVLATEGRISPQFSAS